MQICFGALAKVLPVLHVAAVKFSRSTSSWAHLDQTRSAQVSSTEPFPPFRESPTHQAPLDGISGEAIRNVIRHLSLYPGRALWRYNINTDALSALLLPGLVSAVVRRTFNRLRFGNRMAWPPNSDPDDDAGAVILPNMDVQLLNNFLLACGDALTDFIVMSSWPQANGSDWQEMLQTLHEKSVGLRTLKIRGIVTPLASSLLQATSGRLLKATADANHTRSIAKHCVGLKHLVLSEAPSSIRSLLCTVGPTLEYIEIMEE